MEKNRMHSISPFHNGSNINASITCFITLTYNADAKEIGSICQTKQQNAEVISSLKTRFFMLQH
jgi:hypothetical protein